MTEITTQLSYAAIPYGVNEHGEPILHPLDRNLLAVAPDPQARALAVHALLAGVSALPHVALFGSTHSGAGPLIDWRDRFTRITTSLEAEIRLLAQLQEHCMYRKSWLSMTQGERAVFSEAHYPGHPLMIYVADRIELSPGLASKIAARNAMLARLARTGRRYGFRVWITSHQPRNALAPIVRPEIDRTITLSRDGAFTVIDRRKPMEPGAIGNHASDQLESLVAGVADLRANLARFDTDSTGRHESHPRDRRE